MIENDRRADCSHTFQRKCQMYTRVVLAGKSKETTWRISRRKFCCNLFLLLVLKRRQRQLQNQRKHRCWLRKIFMKRQDTLNFSPAITIADDRRRVFPYDRSAIVCDHMETSLKQAYGILSHW